MLATTGILNDLSPEEMNAELASFMKTGTSSRLTLEQVIELQRAKMRAEGRKGTPVTADSLAKWKADRAEKRRLEAVAKVEAELKKKKGGKGLSVLSGRELFAYNKVCPCKQSSSSSLVLFLFFFARSVSPRVRVSYFLIG